MYKVTAMLTENGTTTTAVIHGSKLDLLARITRGQLKEYVNSVPTFSFAMYPNNPGYDLIKNRLTKIVVTDDLGEDIFIGLVCSAADVMSDDGILYKSVIAKGELDYLNDVIISSMRITSGTYLEVAITRVLAIYNQKASSSKTIQMSSPPSVQLPGSYVADYKTAAAMIKELCEMCENEDGGTYEYRINYENNTRYLEVSSQFGSDSSTELALSVNLQSMQRTIESTNIITRYYPLGAVDPTSSTGERLKLSNTESESYIGSNELEAIYGVCEAVGYYDDIKPDNWTVDVQKDLARMHLRAAAQKDYNKMIGTTKSFSIKAVDLSFINGSYESLRLYNTYRVINKLQNIDDKARITGRTLDIDNPQNPTLTFGQKQATLTAMIAKQ